MGYFEKDTFLEILFHLFPYLIFQLHLYLIFCFLSGNVFVFCVSMSEMMQKKKKTKNKRKKNKKKNRILTKNPRELKTRNTKDKGNVNSIKGIRHTNLTLKIYK